MPPRKTAAKPATPVARTAVMTAEVAPPQPREFWVLKTDPQWKNFNGIEYFYDGVLPVKDGLIRVPVSRTDWVRRLLFSNYAFADSADEAEFNAA